MTIWLFGDSIFQGSRLSRLACPEAIKTPVLVLNRLSDLGFTLYPKKLDVSHKADLSARRIRRVLKYASQGDQVVLEDVGEHSGNPDQHADAWRTVVDAATRKGLRVHVLESFNGASAKPSCRYDLPIDGRTMNEAQRGAAGDAVPLMTALKGHYLKDGVHLDVWGQLRLCRIILAALGSELRGRKSLCELMVTHWSVLGATSPQDAKELVRAALS